MLVVLLTASAAQALDVLNFNISGGGKALEGDLRGASLLLTAQRDGNTNAQDLLAAAQAEYGRLIGALYAQGYYSPVINILVDGREAAAIPPLDAPQEISRIEVKIQTGLPFSFSTAQVAPLARNTELPQGFHTGGAARSGEIQGAVQAGVDGWRVVGHAKAAVASQIITADHARQTLSATVALDPGPRLRFGALTITGASRMREDRIRAIAGLPEGQVFSPEDLARSVERLRRTGVFRSVTVTEDAAITAPDLLGITASVVEDKLHRYSFGAEVASLDGVKLSGAWLHRNLLGGAERLAVTGEVANIGAQTSGVDTLLGLTLSRPATFTPDTTLRFHIEAKHLNEKDFNENSGGVGVGLDHIFTNRLTGHVGLEYTYSDVTDLSGGTIYRNLALPVGATWDNRDQKLDAHKGVYLEAEAKPFLGFGTTNSGLRLTADARGYRALGANERVVLAGRLQLGAVFGPSLAGTPRDYLFYSGGGGTVRGQPYQSLGVSVLSAGGTSFQTGGMAFLAFSTELRAKVSDKIGVVGFFDIGHVGALDFFDSFGGWHSGAGIGVRYDTGFGPIRLDVAAPVGGKTDAGVQIYVGIGQSF